MKIFKALFCYVLILLSLHVFAEPVGDLELEEDLELLDFSGLSLDEEDAPLELPEKPSKKSQRQPVKIEEVMSECRCQCLTKGTKAKNNRSFLGTWVGDSCLCACATRR